MAIIDPNDLIGRTYLTAPAEDGQRMRLRIVEVLEDDEDERLKDPTLIKFKAVDGQDTYEEIIAYNQLMGYLRTRMATMIPGVSEGFLHMRVRYHPPTKDIKDPDGTCKWNGKQERLPGNHLGSLGSLIQSQLLSMPRRIIYFTLMDGNDSDA